MNWLAPSPPFAKRSGTNLASAEGCLLPYMHVDRSHASKPFKHKRSVEHILQAQLGIANVVHYLLLLLGEGERQGIQDDYVNFAGYGGQAAAATGANAYMGGGASSAQPPLPSEPPPEQQVQSEYERFMAEVQSK